MSLDRKFLKAQMFYEKEISDLEAKLAEKDKQLEKLKSENHALISDNAYKEADMFEFNSRIEQLQKKLTMKEKELENYKLCKCVNCTNEYEFMLEGLVEDLEKELDKADQDKISFAVEQLEKVKELLYAELRFDYSLYLRAMHEIDNQIKQLKEME